MLLKIIITGNLTMLTKITFDLPDFSLVFQNATASTLQEAGFKVEQEAKETARVDSGYYRNNIGFDGKNKVIANADYSTALEYGTKPHVIEPKSAKFLHFQKDGKDVFAKIVHHPGTKPLAIMRNAALKVQKQVGSMFINNFKNNLGKYRIK